MFLANLAVAQGETSIQTAIDSTSGEQLYACNAKIRHPENEEIQECLNLSTGESCNPKDNKPGDGACVCQAKRNFGDQLIAVSGGKFQTAVANQNWVGLLEDRKSFGNRLSHIDINLGSESLGAEYIIRFCYLGPNEIKELRQNESGQLEETGVDLSEGKYRLDVSLAGTNYNRALDYASFSYACDYRDAGLQALPRAKDEMIPKPELNSASPSWGILEPDGSFSHTFLSRANGDADSVGYQTTNLLLNISPTKVARFCVFEFRFKERQGSTLKRDPTLTDGNFRGKIRVCKLENCPSSL